MLLVQNFNNTFRSQLQLVDIMAWCLGVRLQVLPGSSWYIHEPHLRYHLEIHNIVVTGTMAITSGRVDIRSIRTVSWTHLLANGLDNLQSGHSPDSHWCPPQHCTSHMLVSHYFMPRHFIDHLCEPKLQVEAISFKFHKFVSVQNESPERPQATKRLVTVVATVD